MITKKYLSVPQAARLCQVDRSTMHRWVSSGDLKCYRTPGGHKRIPLEVFKKWMADNRLPFDLNESADNTARILIVDDDTGVQHYLKKILSGFLIEIETASDGFEAGKKLMQFNPDLMILDLFMPNMNGFEVCREVRSDRATRHIKILILSGHGTQANMDKAISVGADAFLHKPASRNTLLQCVKNLLSETVK